MRIPGNDNSDRAEVSYIKGEDADQLAKLEYEHMQKRPQGDATGHSPDQLVALAISGGGIRSAVFALGFLQSLASKGHLKKIDYLSTVSGGGYIGSAFSWLLHQFWPAENGDGHGIRYGADREHFPFATSPREEQENRKRNESLINFMRRNRQYLLPGDGIGVFSLIAVLLRGVILNALVYLPIIAIGFLSLQVLADFLLRTQGVRDLLDPLVQLPPLQTLLAEAPSPDWQPQFRIGLLLMAFSIIAFGAYLTATVAYALRTVHSRSGKRATYGYRRHYEKIGGNLLLAALCLAAVATVPWVAMYLESPAVVGSAATGTGLLAGLLAFWKTQSKVLLRLPMPLLVWVGGIALNYGILLISLILCARFTEFADNMTTEVGDWLPNVLLMSGGLAAIMGTSLFLGWFVDLNAISLHRFYRDRLMETFMPDPREVFSGADVRETAELADATRLSGVCRYQREEKDNTGGIQNTDIHKGAVGPYHLINNNVVLTKSANKTLRARGGDSFLLSPLYCGSRATGWRATHAFSGDRVTLASAMATSGAAVNPDTGVGGEGATRNPALSAFMRMLNLRLGYWVPNPWRDPGFLANTYRPSLIVEGLLPRCKESAGALELTDGGHFDNLAIYELVRRKVPFIILLDGAADPGFEFADFANLLEKIRADFGVTIDIEDLDKLIAKRDGGEEPRAKAGVVAGVIHYGSSFKGKLFYVKTTLIDGLPEDIYGYWRRHNEFPDESTADQFFDEKQFEAYRELGYQLGSQLDLLTEFGVVKNL